MVATESLLDGNQLSLTQLGRNITGSVAAKHNIKRIDRLLSNHHLSQDKITLYQWHARYLCGSNPMLIILVDWSDVLEQLRIMTLRASISVQGLSVTYMNALFYLKTTTHLAAIIRFSLNSPMFYLKAVARSSWPMQAIAIPGLGKWSATAGSGLVEYVAMWALCIMESDLVLE